METGDLDDKVITDNGDSEKVLATVVAAIYAFADRYTESWIYATGSTTARTRLYRMGINKYFEIVSADLILWESVKTNGNGMNLEKITRLLQYIKKAVNLNNENNA